MKLINPTDLELDVAFAIEVAGYKIMLGRYIHPDTPPEYNVLAAPFAPPEYTKSADAVLPWLEKTDLIAEIIRAKGDHAQGWRMGWRVSIGNNETNIGSRCFGDTLAKSIVIALLLAHGIEVEFK